MQAGQDLPDHLKMELMEYMEELQIKDTIGLVNRLSEACFKGCVTTFHGKNLQPSEEACLKSCTQKFLNMSVRMGKRMQDIQMEKQESAMAEFNQAGGSLASQ